MLTIIQVGSNKASNIYVRNKLRAVEEVGLKADRILLPETATTEDIVWRIKMAAKWSAAIIVQLPLPDHIDKDAVLEAIPPELDIDGLHPHSPYKPLTPCAIMRWLREKEVDLVGKNVTILGRSALVGKPLANMMIDASATVAVCNSHTPYDKRRNLVGRADIVVSAVGKPRTITKDHVDWYRHQIFVDVGINRDEEGKLCGDISDSAKRTIERVGSEYTPVPGGVGKWTVRELVIRLGEMERAKTDKKRDEH